MAQVEIVNNIRLNAGLKDKDGNLGTSGQVLSSTGDAVDWIDPPASGISGSGTTNFVAKFTSTSQVGNSQIKDDGTHVGIGTVGPTKKLSVVELDTSEQCVAEFKTLSTTRGYISVRDANTNTLNDFVRFGAVGNELTLWSNNSEAVRIDTSQNFGVGNTNPSYRLDVLAVGTIAARFYTGTDDTKIIIQDNDTVKYIGVKDQSIYIGSNQAWNNEDNLQITDGNIGIGRRIYHNNNNTTWVGFETNNEITLTADSTPQLVVTSDNVNITDTLSYTYPTATGQYHGEIVTFGSFINSGSGSNGTIAAGDVIVYTSAGLASGWVRAQGTVTYGKAMLGIAMGTTPSAGILIKGFARNTAFSAGSLGDVLYLSPTSAGDTTNVIPSANGNIVRIVGYMLNPTNDEIFFDPDKSWVQVVV